MRVSLARYPNSSSALHVKSNYSGAYNVALTRFIEVWQPNRQKKIAPMVDMINHSSEPNVAITFDDDGNCQVTTLYDIPAGSALTISLGDPTNP